MPGAAGGGTPGERAKAFRFSIFPKKRFRFRVPERTGNGDTSRRCWQGKQLCAIPLPSPSSSGDPMNASVTHQQQLLPSQRAHRTGPVTRRSTSRMSTVTRASTVRNNTARGPSSLQTHILTRSLLECEFPTPSRAADPFPFLLPPPANYLRHPWQPHSDRGVAGFGAGRGAEGIPQGTRFQTLNPTPHTYPTHDEP